MHIPPLAFIQNLRAPEIILIFLVILLLFGAKRLPELFKSFGKSIKEFKKATADIEDDICTAMNATETPTPTARVPRKQVKSDGTPAPVVDTLEQDEPEKPETTHSF